MMDREALERYAQELKDGYRGPHQSLGLELVYHYLPNKNLTVNQIVEKLAKNRLLYNGSELLRFDAIMAYIRGEGPHV